MGIYFSAFPEQHIDVDDLIAEGDRVVVRHTHNVTHGGDFVGMPPTGRQAVISGTEVFRLVDGKVAEMWHQDDLLSLLQQLGAIPTPGGDRP
jgi:predicted ester cyclase